MINTTLPPEARSASSAEPCLLCAGAGRSSEIVDIPHSSLPLARCTACGLVFLREVPREEELAAMYAEEYFRDEANVQGGYEDYAGEHANLLRTANRRLSAIEGLRPAKGRLLDVGCALGSFISAAGARGWEVAGTDVSDYAVDFASRLVGGDVRRAADLREAKWPAASFDVVTLWDVIEHFPDPLDQLRVIWDLLVPGGIVVLYTPDVGSGAARLMRSRWLHYKAEHLFYFNRATLREALHLTGFRVRAIDHVGKDVSLAMAANRVGVYSRPAGWAAERFIALTRSRSRGVYLNPGDGLLMVGVKPMQT